MGMWLLPTCDGVTRQATRAMLLFLPACDDMSSQCRGPCLCGRWAVSINVDFSLQAADLMADSQLPPIRVQDDLRFFLDCESGG